MTGTNATKVRQKLEALFESFGPHPRADESIHLDDLGRVAISSEFGTTISYHGKDGMMVAHRCPRGDISLATSQALGNLEGISRHHGALQGFDRLPKEVVVLIDKLRERSNN